MNVNENRKPVCLITGGSSGIGLATAIRFAREGYHIAICGRRREALESATSEILAAGKAHAIGCRALVADLGDVEQAVKFGRDAIEHFGAVDVLVNNAATAPLAPFAEISADTFEAAVDTNIRSIFYLTQLVWKQMIQAAQCDSSSRSRQSRGVIVNISSLAAVDPFPGFSLYGACKSWLELLTQALATEGQELRIRVCAIRPGAVETPLLRNLFPDYPPEQCVRPDEIADAVWACVQQPDRFPSGQAFSVVRQPKESQE